LPYFPQTIPTHYDFWGKPNDFSNKTTEYVLAVVFSISGFVMLIIALLVDKFHSDDEESSIKASDTAILVAKCGIVMMFLFIIMQCSELMKVYYYTNNMGSFPDLKIVNITLMILMIYLGNIIPKSKKNSVAGIRTSWSFKSDEAWYGSQKSGGKAMMISSLFVLIIALLIPERYQLIVLLIAPIFIVASTLIISHKGALKEGNVGDMK
jgi:uncharacterized membrane protein